ncbi:MAG TPA: hypothetical protein VMZ31_02515 [Phycisphaerae bacterium]|nr:hypothetical protein [Phycisphaerae bacterium]
MSPSLPPSPSLEQLRNQAKDLLKAHEQGRPSCCGVLRRLKQFEGKSDADILAGSVGLVDVQYALAMDFGFKSWPELKRYVERQAKVTPGKVDYAHVALRGNGTEADSFCLAMQEASRLLGRRVTYESLLALTANAFAPGFDTGNDCKELWVSQAWISHVGPVQTAWQRLGLSVEPVALPRHPGRSGSQQALRAHRQGCAHAIRPIMEAGHVVVTSGGWETRKGAWVEPWWAGIVTQVTDDGAILGAHLNGKTDNEIADLVQGEVFAVRLVDPELDEEEANAALFQIAVSRIEAKGEAFARREYSAFGVDAMDEWIGQMERVAHFCPPCQTKAQAGWKSASVVARAMTHRSGVAAGFLREQMPSFSQTARPHVAGAASHYDQVAQLLAPAISENGSESYREFIGDLEKQKVHADKVLRPVKAELLAVADGMRKALAAVA